MYSNKFVLAVKAQGKILRESAESVSLPFGQEFSLLLKNKNSVRARVSVEIDGVDVLDGDSLIIGPNQDIDLERFMKNGNMSNGNRFKFIERSEKIENGPRGIKSDDGLVRVMFEFEQQKAAYIPGPIIGSPLRGYPYREDYWLSRSYGDGLIGQVRSANLNSNSGISAALGSLSTTETTGTAKAEWIDSIEISNATAELASQSALVNQVGITVPGSISNQRFSTTSDIVGDGVQHCMVLQLVGQIGEIKVQEPVTVKTKVECQVCGTQNKYGTKFCGECGAGLQIV